MLHCYHQTETLWEPRVLIDYKNDFRFLSIRKKVSREDIFLQKIVNTYTISLELSKGMAQFVREALDTRNFIEKIFNKKDEYYLAELISLVSIQFFDVSEKNIEQRQLHKNFSIGTARIFLETISGVHIEEAIRYDFETYVDGSTSLVFTVEDHMVGVRLFSFFIQNRINKIILVPNDNTNKFSKIELELDNFDFSSLKEAVSLFSKNEKFKIIDL